jgi:hypothetical protein
MRIREALADDDRGRRCDETVGRRLFSYRIASSTPSTCFLNGVDAGEANPCDRHNG